MTFYRNPEYSLKRKVGETVEKILSLMKKKPSITQKELIDKTGLTRRGVEWNIKKLKEEGFIRRVGSDRSGHWEVIKK